MAPFQNEDFFAGYGKVGGAGQTIVAPPMMIASYEAMSCFA